MYEFTPADPTIRRPGDETPLAEKRKILFIYIPLVAFASMMSGILFGENQAVTFANLILGILVNVLALMWAKLDAEERSYELSRHFTLAVVIFGIFAIIYYLFRSRGMTGGLVTFGLLILYHCGHSLRTGRHHRDRHIPVGRGWLAAPKRIRRVR